ncbi:MAG: multiheme c-type cytochrome [Deltaproteobacteria bacterium]|nr:multiheme c-type cytochrome [Deltaproteobacteria bacterium]
MNRFSDAAHRTLACEECHKDMASDQQPHPDDRDTAFLKADATRVYDYSRCKSCHRSTYERYLKGAHAEALKKELKEAVGASETNETKNRRAPTCGDCHSGHYAKSHLSRVETGRNMTLVCGSCHKPQMLSYLNNYHGKAAVNLGDPDSAYCSDCHGAHECIALKDGATARAACRRCHPEAGDSFARFVIHPVMADDALSDDSPASAREKETRVALIRVVTIIMSILVLFVVCFFYGHTFIWMLRELHEKLRRHGS